MAFPTYNFSFNQGATFQKQLVYRQPDGTTPVDLTGYSARMHLRTDIKSPEIVLNLTTENGGIEIAPDIGRLTIKFTAAQTEVIHAREYVYDIELYRQVGQEVIVTRLIEGKITLRPEVTRPEGLP
jgi:hypothetical protein